MERIKRFLKEEDGLELSEYAIMAGMIILVAIATILLVGEEINRVFNALLTELRTVPS